MTVLSVRRPPPAAPALGGISSLGRRRVTLRVIGIAALLVAALGLRASGVLHPSASLPPPLAGWARVEPGVVRGSQPADLDLIQLRDGFGVRAVVDVDGTDVNERAVTRGLGLRLLVLNVGTREAPSAADLIALARFLPTAGGTVYLHDSTGNGSVVVVAAALRVMHGESLAGVVRTLSREDITALSVPQLLALTDIESVMHGGRPRTAGYAALRGVTR
jgi:hypothetical protein